MSTHLHVRRIAAAIAAAALVAGGLFVISAGGVGAQQDSPGWPQGLVANKPGALRGYTLYSPMTQEATYLVDMKGNVVHQWFHDNQPGLYQYLGEDGSLLRAGRIRRETRFQDANGWGGVIEKLDWDGNRLWRFEYADDNHLQHHDIEELPNGNVLILAWEYHGRDDAIAAGRDPDLLPDGEVWADSVAEYDPVAGRIVWEWSVWDHLVQDHDSTKANFGVVADHPEKVDVNFSPKEPLQTPGEADWNHANSVDYNAELDQIVISLRSFSEIWVVDHATTTEEARGPAGDLLFRYGNPASYRKGKTADRTLFAQHDAEWIADGLPGAGRILVFNNGLVDRREYSSVDEIIPKMDGDRYVVDDDEAFAAKVRRVHPAREQDRVFAAIISGAQRLSNGNTLVTYGTYGLIREVTPKGRVVWEYEVPYFAVRPQTPLGNLDFVMKAWRTFRAERYPVSYPAFEGRELKNIYASQE